MEINRRDFVVLAAATCAGCKAGGIGSGKTSPVSVDAGPASQYSADGVYDRYRGKGFFVISESGKLSALSSVCTHRDCRLKSQPDRTFFCKCHGSRFSEDGKVTKGPATRDLPHFATSVSDEQHLVVQVIRPEFDSE